MNGPKNSWGGMRLTYADVPALLLTGVSAVTVTTGARLLRGQNPLVMFALGIGVAGATFLLDKLLVERFNAVRPRQSLTALLLCWFPMFLFATALATFATFSWIAPEITRLDLDHGRRAHWTDQADKVSTYLLLLTSALRKQTETTQSEIDAERRRVTAARIAGAEHPPDALRALQRRMSAIRDLERRIPAVQRLPLDAPEEPTMARQQVERTFRDLGDVHASAILLVAVPPVLPAYTPFTAPATDLQSVVSEETRKRTWRAVTAWGAALWVEVLPLLALWRGGRKVPLATRVLQWRGRVIDTVEALRGSASTPALPIVIEPLQVRGVVRIAAASEFTLSDCTPLLEEAVGALTGVLGEYRLNGVSNARGENLDEMLPLLPQLNGEPLVLSVVEGRQ
jgi:hypothetical protein